MSVTDLGIPGRDDPINYRQNKVVHLKGSTCDSLASQYNKFKNCTRMFFFILGPFERYHLVNYKRHVNIIHIITLGRVCVGGGGMVLSGCTVVPVMHWA